MRKEEIYAWQLRTRASTTSSMDSDSSDSSASSTLSLSPAPITVIDMTEDPTSPSTREQTPASGVSIDTQMIDTGNEIAATHVREQEDVEEKEEGAGIQINFMEKKRLFANAMTDQRVEIQTALQLGRWMGRSWNVIIKEGARNRKNRERVGAMEEWVEVTDKLVRAGLLRTGEEEIKEWKAMVEKVAGKNKIKEEQKKETKLEAAILETHALAKDVHTHLLWRTL